MANVFCSGMVRDPQAGVMAQMCSPSTCMEALGEGRMFAQVPTMQHRLKQAHCIPYV